MIDQYKKSKEIGMLLLLILWAFINSTTTIKINNLRKGYLNNITMLLNKLTTKKDSITFIKNKLSTKFTTKVLTNNKKMIINTTNLQKTISNLKTILIESSIEFEKIEINSKEKTITCVLK